jgi:hypothetical protein
MDVNTIEMANSIARALTKTWIAYLDTYMQGPNPGEEPTCRLMIVKDKYPYSSIDQSSRRKISLLNMEDPTGKSFGIISV